MTYNRHKIEIENRTQAKNLHKAAIENRTQADFDIQSNSNEKRFEQVDSTDSNQLNLEASRIRLDSDYTSANSVECQ